MPALLSASELTCGWVENGDRTASCVCLWGSRWSGQALRLSDSSWGWDPGPEGPVLFPAASLCCFRLEEQRGRPVLPV